MKDDKSWGEGGNHEPRVRYQLTKKHGVGRSDQ